MENVRAGLLACFQSVFPDLDGQTLVHLSQDRHAAWDSLQSVILVRLIEEQFNIQLDLFDLEGLVSFEAIEEYLRSRTPGA